MNLDRSPGPAAAPPAPAALSTPLPTDPVHDFTGKLRQPGLLPRVVEYVAWQRAARAAADRGQPPPAFPEGAPLSINLDLTTACNYACDHCIDWEVLNSGISYQEKELRASLERMAAKGLRSVILIGGGEPTVYPGFVGFARFAKDLGLQVAVVSNGGRNDRVLEVVDRFDAKDWIRLSLDSGTDETFQRMHKPKKAVTLPEICSWIPRIKERNPLPRVGFSFIITWEGAEGRPGAAVVENLDEIPLAARLARDSGFDYVSFKPFLLRTPEGAEVMDVDRARAHHESVVQRIRAKVDEAKRVATPTFRVVESTNLRVLERGTWKQWTHQPKTCHMQALRQVLTPMGLYNCPAHRGVDKAKIAGNDAYASDAASRATADATAAILSRFDATHECREITCLYHGANWWLERAIEGNGLAAADAVAESGDWFL